MEKFISGVWGACVTQPLACLYWKGPSIYGFGFWESRDPAEICSALTNVDAKFWLASDQSWHMCEQLLSKKYDAFVVGTFGSAFVLLGSFIVVTFVCRCLIVRPVVDAIQTLSHM